MKHRFGLIPAILLCVGATLPQAARADAYGTSVLDFSRIALTHAGGTPYSATDFTQSSVSYYGSLLVWDGSKSVSVGGGDYGPQTTDLTVTCMGTACPASADNDFEPLSGTPTGAYANADQRQSGSLLGNDLRMQVRADAGGHAQATGVVAARLQFQLSAPGIMTIDLEATPFATVWRPEAVGQPDGTALVGNHVAVTIYNLTTGQILLHDTPNPFLTNVESPPGNTLDPYSRVYDPGLQTFSLQSPMLNTTDTYELTIYAATFAWVTNPIPEPSSIAMLGTGLVLMLGLGWRRKVARQRSTSP